MQGLADGYFVAPYTVGDYLAGLLGQPTVDVNDPAFTSAVQNVKDQMNKWISIGGTKSPDYFHRELGKIMWDNCGMAREKNGLEKAISEIRALRDGAGSGIC